MIISAEEAKRITIQSYNDHIEEYVEKVDSAKERTLAYWPGVALFLSYLSPGQEIFEIGSGSGGDAQSIESQGFQVRRSDVTEAFLKVLHVGGYEAEYYDALEGSIAEKQSAIFANAVFLHFTPRQFRLALTNVWESLIEGGLFCMGMKLGDFEGWREKGLSDKRYFKFWALKDLQEELQEANLAVVATYVTPDKDFAVITSRRLA